MDKPLLFQGTLIHSLDYSQLQVIQNGLLVVGTDSRILALQDLSTKSISLVLQELELVLEDCTSHQLGAGEFLIPGFVDTHNHAPQWAQRGLGQGLHILDWLDKITFPNEARFSDPDHAKRVYSDCVAGFLRQGITTASYYGSVHPTATKILADECLKQGQRAFVGKCNMNRNAPDYYRDESVESSVAETKDCIAYVRGLDPGRAQIDYVVTPRFAITCEDELLSRLGKLAEEEKLLVQTHFNEAEQEMKATAELFPSFQCEADLYNHFGLLTHRSILAHCCFMSDYELNELAKANAGVAHCPVSNMTVGGGFMTAHVREFIRRNIKVGLGTDSGGGYSSSMLDVMRLALITSNAREVASGGADVRLSLEELFYLATVGGAKVCNLGDTIGNFVPGKEFDALWVTGSTGSSYSIMTPLQRDDSPADMLEKFIMTGDDRNIKKVYVRGRLVKS